MVSCKKATPSVSTTTPSPSPTPEATVYPEPIAQYDLGYRALNIPFEVDENGKAYIWGQINGSRRIRFLVDSGADSLLILDRGLAESMKLKLVEGYQAKGTGSSIIAAAVSKDVAVNLPGVDLLHLEAFIIPLHEPEPQGHKEGLLGLGLFKNPVIEFNYEKRLLSIYDPRVFEHDGSGEVINMTRANGFIYLPALVVLPNIPPIRDVFKVDTGSGGSLTFHTPYVNKHQLLNRVPIESEHAGIGIGGENKIAITTAKLIQVGEARVANPWGCVF